MKLRACLVKVQLTTRVLEIGQNIMFDQVETTSTAELNGATIVSHESYLKAE